MKAKKSAKVLATDLIERRIYLTRGQKVMLDRDLAELYMVGTRDLNKAVSRNSDHFPIDFMFVLTQQEVKNLMFQIGTSSWGGTRKLPHAFTEHGILMLSSVLRSERATQVNIQIMRTFAKLREIIASHQDLARRLSELEGKYDGQFKVVFEAIRRLMAPPEPPKRRIGFHA